MKELVTVTRAADETLALAAQVGALLRAGDVVALTGDLGAGKTVFTKGLGRGLGVDEPIVSPTFTVVREYACASGGLGRPVRLVHVDVYRLDRVQELHDVGWDDFLDDESVAVVEWGERVGALLPLDRLEVSLEHGDGDDVDDPSIGTRVVTFAPSGPSWVARADALAALVESRADAS